MQAVQRDQFESRISRIKAGGPNTFSTVYTGSQDTVGKDKVSGARHNQIQNGDAAPKLSYLIGQGFKTGVVRLVALGAVTVLWLALRSHI